MKFFPGAKSIAEALNRAEESCYEVDGCDVHALTTDSGVVLFATSREMDNFVNKALAAHEDIAKIATAEDHLALEASVKLGTPATNSFKGRR